MKKLLILSSSFVSLMSTTNFFFLRLDRFIQFLNTSSVIIGLELVFSNLCLTVSENLLSLSFQKDPNLFTFRVLSESLGIARDLCHGKQRVSKFYHALLTTSTTDRTTGLLLQRTRPSKSTSVENGEKQDRSSNPYWVLSHW